MGKDKKKDKKKKGLGAEKTAAKTAKNAAKREKKERGKTGEPEEEDIEAILAQLALQDKQRMVVTETPCLRPSPRVHASFLTNPAKDKECLIFGGEYYNGERVYVYNDLFRLKDIKGQLTWSQISSPNTPKPRSSHQAIASRTHMYVIGGEFTSPSQMQFYHHKDMWRLDLATSKWEEVSIKGGPTPRSGHRAVLWRNSIFVFGGFYDTGHDVKYHNDAYLFDMTEQKWTKLGEDKKGDNASWPSPRSAVGLAAFEDSIFVYGGFTKSGRCLSSSDDSRGTVHVDLWSFDLRANVWSKVRRAGIPPSPRCGFSVAVHKRRNLIVFGGVFDQYDKHDLISTFYNDIYVFRMDQHRWFPLTLRKPGSKEKKSRRSGDRTSSCSGWDTLSSVSELDNFERRENEDEEEFQGRKAMRKAMRRAAMQQKTYVLEEEDGEEARWSDEDEEHTSTTRETGQDAPLSVGGQLQQLQGDDVAGSDTRHAQAPAPLAVDMPGDNTCNTCDTFEDLSWTKEQAAGVCDAGGDEKKNRSEEGKGDCGGEAEAEGELTLESLVRGLILEAKKSEEEEEAERKAEEERMKREAAEQGEEEGVTCPRKRINPHILIQDNNLLIFGGKVDSDKVEVTLDDLWMLDVSKLLEYRCLEALSAAASVWVEEEDDGEGSGPDDEPPEDWNSDEEGSDDDEEDEDEEGEDEEGEEGEDEDENEDEDEEEKAKRLEIDRKKEEGRKKKEAAKKEKEKAGAGGARGGGEAEKRSKKEKGKKEASEGEEKLDEEPGEEDDEQDEDERLKWSEIERKEGGSLSKEAARKEAAQQEAKGKHGSRSAAVDEGGVQVAAAVGEVGGDAWRKAVLAMDDAELVHSYCQGVCAKTDLKELLFVRELDPARYLEITMKIKAERSKTAEEEEEQRLEAARNAEVSAAAAAKAKLLTSRQARLLRGIELRRLLQQYPEASTPKLNELLKDFFDRTLDYWTLTAHELLETTGKKMRRDAFNLASQHFREVQPLLAEFSELLRMERENEADQIETENAGGKMSAASRPREHK